jgi:hypothetical protein
MNTNTTRRGFIGALLASIAGTAFLHKDLLWLPAPLPDLPTVAPGALLTLDAITMEVARQIEDRLRLPVEHSEFGLKVGDQGMRQQFGVNMIVPHDLEEAGLDAGRYIVPVATALAAKIRDAGWNRFGELALPSLVSMSRCTSAEVSVRGCLYYEVERDLSFLRMDVIGG